MLILTRNSLLAACLLIAFTSPAAAATPKCLKAYIKLQPGVQAERVRIAKTLRNDLQPVVAAMEKSVSGIEDAQIIAMWQQVPQRLRSASRDDVFVAPQRPEVTDEFADYEQVLWLEDSIRSPTQMDFNRLPVIGDDTAFTRSLLVALELNSTVLQRDLPAVIKRLPREAKERFVENASITGDLVDHPTFLPDAVAQFEDGMLTAINSFTAVAGARKWASPAELRQAFRDFLIGRPGERAPFVWRMSMLMASRETTLIASPHRFYEHAATWSPEQGWKLDPEFFQAMQNLRVAEVRESVEEGSDRLIGTGCPFALCADGAEQSGVLTTARLLWKLFSRVEASQP